MGDIFMVILILLMVSYALWADLLTHCPHNWPTRTIPRQNDREAEASRMQWKFFLLSVFHNHMTRRAPM